MGADDLAGHVKTERVAHRGIGATFYVFASFFSRTCLRARTEGLQSTRRLFPLLAVALYVYEFSVNSLASCDATLTAPRWRRARIWAATVPRTKERPTSVTRT